MIRFIFFFDAFLLLVFFLLILDKFATKAIASSVSSFGL